jgi:D-lactate dehydrogenase (cytochrome)
MNAINKAGTTRKLYPTQDSLFFKIQGTPEVISKAAKALEAIVKKHSSSRFEFASTEEHAKEMWENRKMALFSSLRLEPGLRCWTTDVWFVPVRRTEVCFVLTVNQRSGISTP